jgi:hypothetical protein
MCPPPFSRAPRSLCAQSETRIKELMALGVAVKVVTIGKKVGSYYKRRTEIYNLTKSFDMGNSPTTAEAQARRRAAGGRTFRACVRTLAQPPISQLRASTAAPPRRTRARTHATRAAPRPPRLRSSCLAMPADANTLLRGRSLPTLSPRHTTITPPPGRG